MTEVPLPLVYAWALLLVGSVVRVVSSGGGGQYPAWAAWLDDRGLVVQSIFLGVCAACFGLLLDWWLRARLAAALAEGGLTLVGFAAVAVVGAGMGLSFGKSLTDADYEAIQP